MRWKACQLLIVALTAVIVITPVSIGDPENPSEIDFWEAKLTTMQNQVRWMVIKSHICMWLTVVVAAAGIVIASIGTAKRSRFVRILGVMVTVLTATTNIVFGEDHRALRLRAHRCERHLEGAEEALSDVKCSPPRLPFDKFKERFKYHRNNFRDEIISQLMAASGGTKESGKALLHKESVLYAGVGPWRQSKDGSLFEFLGIAEGRHAELATKLARKNARERASAFLRVQFEMIPVSKRKRVNIDKLAAYLAESGKVWKEDYKYNTDENTYRAYVHLVLSREHLICDLEYYGEEYKEPVSPAFAKLLANIEPVPLDFYFKLDSIQSEEKRRRTALAPGLKVTADSPHLHWGIAGPLGTLLPKDFFIINHNDSWRIPYWVAYYLTASDLQGAVDRTDDFRPDPDLPEGFRAELRSYRGSGYDRGHNASEADFRRSSEAMSATFLLSNMSPQTPALNRRIWRVLEKQVREHVEIEGEAWIVTGNLFLTADSQRTDPSNYIGPDSIAVPSHCFKAILSFNEDGGYSACAFLVPNQTAQIPGDPVDYMLTVDRLEDLTGYDFFLKLEDEIETEVEGTRMTRWP